MPASKARQEMTKQEDIQANVYVLQDNIDTDLIIPAQYLNLVPTIEDEYRKLGSYALAGLPDDCPKFIEPGQQTSQYGIIIAGRNFGCGSSREHAPIALGAAGTLAVVAQSYARIFFRNAVSTGEVYPLESKERLCDHFANGHKARISIADSTITNLTTGESFALGPLGAVAPVIEAGGIFAYARQTGMISTPEPTK